MRNVLRSLAVCLGALCVWTGNVHADDCMVSGAGNDDVNGIYVENGTNAGKPMYEYDNGSTVYYLFYFDDMDRGWVISTDTWLWMLEEAHYYNYDNSDTPPLTGWQTGWDGSSPAPEIGAAGPSISYSRTSFIESAYNDGSIDNDPVLEISHNGIDGVYFTGSAGEDFVAGGKVVVTNLPAGLLAEIRYADSLMLFARLRGIAVAHDNADEVTDLTFTFQSSAFNTGDTTGISNTVRSFRMDFIQEYIVGTGGDFTTVASAVSGADAGDILLLTAETFTEAGITIDKGLVIKGQGAGSTIVQAHASKNSASNRVFYISASSAEVTIQDISVRHGNTSYHGGGIYNSGQLTIERCHLYDNRVTGSQANGGGIYSYGSLTVKNSTISGNYNTGTIQYNAGGGIAFSGDTLRMDNSTVCNNSTYGVGNENGVGGGGIYLGGTGIIRNSTICGNSSALKGGGICVLAGRTLYIMNSIVADNSSGTGPDVYTYSTGVVTSQDYNLIENTSDATINGTTTHDITGSDPSLTALADNGGPTYTCALQSGSPAVNAGDDAAASSVDQRYYSRNGVPDIGAFEYIGTVNTPPTVTSSTVDTTRVDEAYEYTATAIDAEDTPSITFENLPAWLSATGNVVTGTPDGWDRDVSFDVIADDGVLSDTITVTLFIMGDLYPLYAEAAVSDTGRYLFNDIGVEIHVTSLTGTGAIAAWVYPDSFASNLPGSHPVKRFFRIVKDAGITDITAEVVFSYEQAEFAASDIADEITLYGARYTGSEWVSYGTVTDTMNNTVMFTTSEFSYWSIGGEGGALPVQLSSFTASIVHDEVVLAWATESETDNLGFNLLRSDNPDAGFIRVNGHLIPGAGTSSLPQAYGYTDAEMIAGDRYYKLAQVDMDGSVSYSAVVAVMAASAGLQNSGTGGPVGSNAVNREVLFNLNGFCYPAKQCGAGIYYKMVDGQMIKVMILK